MRLRQLSSLIFISAGLVAVGAALPAVGQQGPESLLPPGFGDPPPPPPAAKAPSPKQDEPGTTSQSSGERGTARPTSPTASASPSDGTKPEDEEEEETEIRYDVPPTARRSLKQIGIMSEAGGGLPATAFGGIKGEFLLKAARNIKGPLASRWGTVMTRRALASRTNTPVDINGADWAAERAALILRMGDADVARKLVQQVDSSAFSNRLLEVSMPVFLANADLSGMCPIADAASQRTNMPEWKTALSICASLAGEQGRATSLLNQVRNKGWAKGIDYLLAEKAVGAGTNGRRTVKIEWENVKSLNHWRHGIAQSTGVEPPEALYKTMDRSVDGWRVQLPMVSTRTRITAAVGAASLGVLSNRAFVDIYGMAADETELPDEITERIENLRAAFVANNDSAKISAMQALWDSAQDDIQRRGMLVLTARAAALVAPNSGNAGQSDRLIASMLAGGFDLQAARWTNIVSEGSLGWGMLAAGSPEWGDMVDTGALNNFQGNDDSENYHKSAMLLAGLAGLGRVSDDTLANFASDIEVNVTRETKWSRAIQSAAARGESGTVALLAAAGLQASDWTNVPAHHLYHMVAALRTVGLEAEARMIAAEAVGFG